MGEALVAVFMLAQIWAIGKLRYIGREKASKKVPVRFYDQLPLAGILDAYLGDNQAARFVIRTMRMSLGCANAYPLNSNVGTAVEVHETTRTDLVGAGTR
jgi:hypothetical protein